MALRRLVLIGANGQVGTDVCALLAPYLDLSFSSAATKSSLAFALQSPVRRSASAELPRLLADRTYQVIPLTRADLDITSPLAVSNCLRALKPDLVLNTAAYHQVDLCEEEVAKTFAVNTVAVHYLAKICEELAATLVQFSTDFVFGQQVACPQPYTEDDPPYPRNVYATSRLAGEYLVQQTCSRYFLVRTCGLYGLAGKRQIKANFVETMLMLAAKQQPLSVVNDQVVGPTFTQDLVLKLLELWPTEAYGLYHLTNSGACTWYEFAQSIFALSKNLSAVDLRPVSSAAYAAKALRPSYSVLANAALKQLGLAPLRPWQEALAAYVDLRRQLT